MLFKAAKRPAINIQPTVLACTTAAAPFAALTTMWAYRLLRLILGGRRKAGRPSNAPWRDTTNRRVVPASTGPVCSARGGGKDAGGGQVEHGAIQLLPTMPTCTSPTLTCSAPRLRLLGEDTPLPPPLVAGEASPGPPAMVRLDTSAEGEAAPSAAADRIGNCCRKLGGGETAGERGTAAAAELGPGRWLLEGAAARAATCAGLHSAGRDRRLVGT